MNSEDFVRFWNALQWRYLVWWAWGLALFELIDVVLRWRGIPVELVSITARRVVFSGLTAFSFFWGSMTVHWFVTWRRLPWSGTTEHVLGIAFWAVFAAYVVASYADPTPRYWPRFTQVIRYPPFAAVFGGILAFFCFPQRSLWFPGRIP